MKRSSFTLIELLIVITIIMVIAGLVLFSLGPARARGRDAKRIANLGAIRDAVEMYKDGAGQGKYPSTTNSTGASCWIKSDGTTDPVVGCSGAAVANWSVLASFIQPYLSVLPSDPSKNSVYQYKATDSSYKLMAKLEENTKAMLNVNDGGTFDNFYELFNLAGQNISMCPAALAKHVVISEVYYYPSLDKCNNCSASGEYPFQWIEIYNASSSEINLLNWTIESRYLVGQSSNPNKQIITSSTSLLPGRFAILTPFAQSFPILWKSELEQALRVLKENDPLADIPIIQISNLWLTNNGNWLILNNQSGGTEDGMSYGNNGILDPNIFSPTVPVINNRGQSLVRSDVSCDTNTAADFTVNNNPNPGM